MRSRPAKRAPEPVATTSSPAGRRTRNIKAHATDEPSRARHRRHLGDSGRTRSHEEPGALSYPATSDYKEPEGSGPTLTGRGAVGKTGAIVGTEDRASNTRTPIRPNARAFTRYRFREPHLPDVFNCSRPLPFFNRSNRPSATRSRQRTASKSSMCQAAGSDANRNSALSRLSPAYVRGGYPSGLGRTSSPGIMRQ